MKSKADLNEMIQRIASAESPVGMDAVYVHALILDKLQLIEERLETIGRRLDKIERPGDDQPA